jgi:predicted RNase H-like nuclease (RuvC/YqgF family)
MLNTAANKECEENQDFGSNTLQVLEQLEKEAQELNEEKMNLLDMQERLWLKISAEIENRRKKNEELRIEVEELRKKCDELTRVLNTWTAGP